MNEQAKHFYTFGPFRFDPEERLLLRDGRAVPLAPKVADTLLLLIQNAGHLLDKETLMRRVWPDAFVEEGNLNKNVSMLRKVLWDGGREYIETVPKRGYRFVAGVDLHIEADTKLRIAAEVPPTIEEISARAALKPGNGLARPAVERDLPGSTPGKMRSKSPALIGAGLALAIVIAIAVRHWFLATPAVSVPELEERQLTANSTENTVWSGAISPNGKYLAYVDATGIRLKGVETGELGTVPQPVALQSSPVRWRIASWLPDGTAFIAVAMQPQRHSSTWTVSLVGQPPRLIRDNAAAWSVSPDGDWIAFTTEAGLFGDHELWVMRTNSDDARKVVADHSSSFSRVTWSADGSRISYLRRHAQTVNSDISVEVRKVSGGSPVTLISSPHLEDYVWLPAGGRLIYVASEPGSNADSCDFWEMSVGPSGEPQGKPRQLTNWAGFGIDNLSTTANGKVLAFRKSFQQSSVYVADIDSGMLRVSNPSRLTLNEGLNIPTAWSADSKSIIFWSLQKGRTGIFKQSLGKDTAVPLVTSSDILEVPRLGPDGSSILYLQHRDPPSSPEQIMRVPIEGGPPQLVLQADLMATHRCAPVAHLCAIAEKTADRKRIIFTALDLLKGRGRELLRVDTGDPNQYYLWDISPDGRRIALLDPVSGHISILPITQGEQGQEFTIRDHRDLGSFDWAPDGKGFFTSSMTGSGGSALLHVDLHGNARALWEIKGASSAWAVPSPDGSHLVISAWVDSGNIWTIENF